MTAPVSRVTGLDVGKFLALRQTFQVAASIQVISRFASGDSEPLKNPLQLLSALQLAVLFQVVMMLVNAVRDRFGAAGLLTSAAVLGLTDVDALTISMVKSAQSSSAVATAAKAIGIGMLANTLFKCAVAAALGIGRFRLWTVAGLLALGVASAASLWLVE